MSSVLKMALEALQGMRDMWASVCISHGWEPNHLSQYDDAGKAIAALKEAIKNQGEPVAYFDPLVADDDKGLSWTSGTFHTGKLYKGGEL